MNKGIIIGAIIVILALLGFWYFSSPGTGTSTQEQAATTTSATTTGNTTGTTATTGSATFHSIFTQSGNHQCDYSQASQAGQSTSVIYISGGKMHGEFRTVANGISTASLMTYNGGYLYSWKEGATTGKKSSIKTLADLPEVIPQDLTSGAIYGTASNNVGWNCHDWATDAKVFVIPTYVTFTAAS